MHEHKNEAATDAGEHHRKCARILRESADEWDDDRPEAIQRLLQLAQEHYVPGGPSMPAIYLRDRADRIVREAAPRPEIVVLCGSTRFYLQFQLANYELTMAGKIVLSVGFYPHAKATHGHGEGVGHDSAEKVALDELHKRKIDLADRVLVLNVGGYIGESTRGEIEYAERNGLPVDYLEHVHAAAGEQ